MKSIYYIPFSNISTYFIVRNLQENNYESEQCMILYNKHKPIYKMYNTLVLCSFKYHCIFLLLPNADTYFQGFSMKTTT